MLMEHGTLGTFVDMVAEINGHYLELVHGLYLRDYTPKSEAEDWLYLPTSDLPERLAASVSTAHAILGALTEKEVCWTYHQCPE
jgi:hypothetical protein